MLGSGGELARGKAVMALELVGHRVVRVALSVSWFVLYILICIVVVTVPFVWCSVRLPLSRPTSFCLFPSILLPTPAGGGAAERLRGPLALATAKLQH